MADLCPHCGGLINANEDQVIRWRADCKQAGLPILGDRVSESTASQLLGISVKWLSRRRTAGNGPVWSSIPVAGSRISYRLQDLAAFASAHTSGEPWE